MTPWTADRRPAVRATRARRVRSRPRRRRRSSRRCRLLAGAHEAVHVRDGCAASSPSDRDDEMRCDPRARNAALRRAIRSAIRPRGRVRPRCRRHRRRVRADEGATLDVGWGIKVPSRRRRRRRRLRPRARREPRVCPNRHAAFGRRRAGSPSRPVSRARPRRGPPRPRRARFAISSATARIRPVDSAERTRWWRRSSMHGVDDAAVSNPLNNVANVQSFASVTGTVRMRAPGCVRSVIPAVRARCRRTRSRFRT